MVKITLKVIRSQDILPTKFLFRHGGKARRALVRPRHQHRSVVTGRWVQVRDNFKRQAMSGRGRGVGECKGNWTGEEGRVRKERRLGV